MLGITRSGIAALAVLVGLGTGVVPAEAAASPRPQDREITVTRLVDDEGRPLVQPYQINERGQVLARMEGPTFWLFTYWHHFLWHRGDATLMDVPSTPSRPRWRRTS